MCRLWAVAVVLGTVASGAAAQECGTDQVWIDTDRSQDFEIACAGVKRAVESLQRCGPAVLQPLHIGFLLKPGKPAFTKQPTPNVDVLASGYYLAQFGRVYVETSTIPQEDRTRAFGYFLMSDDFLVSTIAHEVAHHVHHCLCLTRGRRAAHAASEYVAYVVQLEALTESERVRVLEHWPRIVLPSRHAVNSFVWAADPPRFGVMAFRYDQKDPELLCDILRGREPSADQAIPHR